MIAIDWFLRRQMLLPYLVLILLLVPTNASACHFTKPLSKEMESAAQIVFRGVPKAYEIVTCPSQGKGIYPLQFARISFVPTETIRGKQSGECKIIWLNGNFGLPPTLAAFKLQFGNKQEIGLAKHGSGAFNLTEAYKDFPKIYATFRDLPCVVQGPCSEPYIKSLP